MLIGERPGPSATNSLGAYFTLAPQRGATDADRNCVSHIRPEGVQYDDAARQIAYLLHASRIRGCSGVAIKNRADDVGLGPTAPRYVMEWPLMPEARSQAVQNARDRSLAYKILQMAERVSVNPR
ncbi:ethanolamine ammonia-lyase light chain EutC [Bradyrhizobium jicamae]|uniref:ethanolamine ammonia-lyase light chain EutC n=1 Tax=Bradyrhizobium jicamae TaxID=280332 RepID=UPI003D9B4958